MEDKRKYSLFPKTLASCVEPLTRPVLKTKGLAGSRILSEWASIVGPQLARHCQPEKLAFPAGKKIGGTLTIAAENGFATELQHKEPQILERIAGYFGYAAVNRIVISHSYVPPAPSSLPAKPKPALPADCAKLADHLEDDALKTALTSFAKTLAGADS